MWPPTTSPTSGGIVLRGFRFVEWFGVGLVGRPFSLCDCIHRIWGRGVSRTPGCNFVCWVGVRNPMRRTLHRSRRLGSGGRLRVLSGRRRGCRGSSSKCLRLRGREGLGPRDIAIFWRFEFGRRCVHSAVMPTAWATMRSGLTYHTYRYRAGPVGLCLGSPEVVCHPGFALNNGIQLSSLLLLR